jgi:hypothetical protein
VAARRAVRAEIEALEHDLAELEPLSGADSAQSGAGLGARLVSTRELEATRDELASRLAELRRQRRQSRKPVATEAPTASPWPELLPLRAAPA